MKIYTNKQQNTLGKYRHISPQKGFLQYRQWPSILYFPNLFFVQRRQSPQSNKPKHELSELLFSFQTEGGNYLLLKMFRLVILQMVL